MTYRMTHPFNSDYDYDYDCDDLDEVIERLRDNTSPDEFDDYLNDCYGTVNICGHEYNAAEALRNTDGRAYDEDFDDWLYTCEEDWRCDLERLDDGDDTCISGYTITCLDDDDGRDLLEDYFDTLEEANAACDACNEYADDNTHTTTSGTLPDTHLTRAGQ